MSADKNKDQTLQDLLRRLPAVDLLLEDPLLLETGAPRPVLKQAVHAVLEEARAEIRQRPESAEERLAGDGLVRAAARRAKLMNRPNFKRVINATGVVIHTNLGRSLLAAPALEAVGAFSRHYTNLEFDLAAGKRGSRYSHVVELLKELTGAEAALVVNNNAAAVLLTLNALGQGREVIVSRGQLVEIGGSFRIPEVMARSGAKLKEVGATNKTHLKDYAGAIGPDTAGLLKVHQSNFAMVGFAKVVSIEELAALAREHGLWLMDDLGSGCLLDMSVHGLMKEPTVPESLAAGADVVTFSGDKLLGGPQAGIILGRAELIKTIQSNPINRAVRIDKMTLAALEATLRLYREPSRALAEIPTLNMLSLSYKRLSARAAGLKARLLKVGGEAVEVRLIRGDSQVGGGALPLQSLPTALVGLKVKGLSAAKLEKAFRLPESWCRDEAPPIIGRIENDWLLFDPRTLQTGEAGLIAAALKDIVIILRTDQQTEVK